MAIVLEGDGTITGVTTFTTPLDDISFDSINVTGIVTASTFQVGTGVSISSPRSQTLALFTNNVEGLHLDDAGRVGIGTTNANKAADTNNTKVVNAGIITANELYDNYIKHPGVAATPSISLNTNNVERLRINHDGKVLIGATSPRVESNGLASPLQVEGTGLSSCSIIIARNSANASSSQLIFQKSRGTSVGSNTVIQSGDAVGTITFEGSDGTNTDPLASIIGACDGTPGTNDVPGRLVFATTADGEASPTERMRIASDGKVGIGTDSIAGKFEVYHTDSKINTLTIRTGAGANGYAGLAFASNQTYAREKAAIYFQETSAGPHHKGDIVFAVDSAGGDAGQVATSDEKVRITSAGLVGIGSDAPSGTLSLLADNPNIRLDDSSGSSNNGEITLDNSQLRIEVDEDNVTSSSQIKFRVDASDKMVINSSGKVGINKTSPSSWLHVVGSNYETLRLENTDGTDNGPYIEFYNNTASPADNDYAGIINFRCNNDNAEDINFAGIRGRATDVSDASEDGTLTFHTRLNGSFGERLKIASDGKIGISESTPANLLHINTSGASGNGILLKSTDDYYPRIRGDANRSSADNYLLHLDGRWNGTSVACIVLEAGTDTTNKDDGQITFRTATAGSTVERMRLDNDGRFGIRTGEGASVSDWLHINTTGSNNTGITLKSTADNYNTIHGNANRTNGDTYLLRQQAQWNGNDVCMITMESGSDTTNKDDGQINFWTQENGGGGQVERLSIEPDGDVRVRTGNLVMSTNGKGIDFSASESSDATAGQSVLDDYEQGTFTAKLYGNTTGSGSDTCDGTGYYTKVGNTVTCSIKISNVNGNNLPDNEQTRIAGIPFVMHANASNQTSAVTFTYNVAFQDDEQNCFIGGSSVSYLRGYRSRDTATWQPWMTQNWRQSQIYLHVNITYLSTA